VTAVPVEARETSGATTGGLLRFVRARGGDEAVAAVLERAGVPWTADDLDDQSRWWSYDTRIRLFAAATEVLGDPGTMYQVGASALQSGLANSIVLLLRAMGSPRQVLRQLPRAVTKFSTTSTMQVLEVGPTSATIRYQLHEGYAHSRLDCDYAQGLITNVPVIFGLPPARIVHDECESDGHAACVYELSWERRRRFGRRRDDAAVDPELAALRGQLQTLQSAAGDLVGSDDVDTALERIVARAAEAVLAPAYLLAVASPDGGAPLVHSAGLPPERVDALAAVLLTDGDMGPNAVVVDVASARRRHGRLAALYRPGDGAMGDETSMLAAYAGHAAAALDLLFALEQSREEAARASALLSLAHELATAEDEAGVCTVVAEALPRIVGCRRAGIMLWDPSTATLRSRGSVGLRDEALALLASTRISAEEVPELVSMLGNRAPRILDDRSSSPVVQALLRGIGTSHLVAVPLISGGTFLGIATAGWGSDEATPHLDEDVLSRLTGVADQAATALEKARLLATVRHQAMHDALTGLPNRVLFLDRLERAIDEVDDDTHLAVLFCDLDLFKQVNDTLGHATGDELLRQVAARLRSTVRPGDTVGRLSGDEFAVILPGLTEIEDAAGLAARITDCFAEPFRLDGTDVRIGTSVGLSATRAGSRRTAEELLRKADAAMYRHKQRARTTAALPGPRG
jgi:diguanylate cyclase (GGDEF)-like protein